MQSKEGKLINIRKMIALDITLHGYRFIILEMGLGTPAIIGAGLWLIISNVAFALGLYLLLTGINYTPLLAYTVIIDRKKSAEIEVEQDLAQNEHLVRKYSLQQLMLFVPLLVFFIALVQEIKKRPIK